RDDQRQLRLSGALVIPQFAEPSRVPGLRPLRFPQNGAAALAARGKDAVHHVAAELALRHRLDQVAVKAIPEQGFELYFERLTLQLLRTLIGLATEVFDLPLHA